MELMWSFNVLVPRFFCFGWIIYFQIFYSDVSTRFRVVFVRIKKRNIVARSSVEAEYLAKEAEIHELTDLKQLLQLKLGDIKEIQLICDN